MKRLKQPKRITSETGFGTSHLGQGPKGEFDTAYLKAIHRHLFQDVYEWAGRTRDDRVMLSDGTIASEPVLRKGFAWNNHYIATTEPGHKVDVAAGWRCR
jgi:fido (protein-threonine AMPylation protein)